jgi:hypothetical protein
MPNKKSLASMTRLEAERESKKRAGEESELIEQMGQDSDRRAKAVVKYYLDQVEDTEEKYKNEALQILEGLKKRSNLHYNSFLEAATQRFLSQEDLPQKYQIRVISNKTGIIATVVGTDFYGAFKSSYIPFYDYTACKILAVKVGNTVAKLEGHVRATPGGVLLPDSQDLKSYGRNN